VVDRIFDPFFTTKSQGGTGLGLAISRKIVEEARGAIAVDSAPARGTRFAVTLPAAARR
jgi:signal transduction histidine kinase